MARSHGVEPRGLTSAPRSDAAVARFGRMFRALPAAAYGKNPDASRQALTALAVTLVTDEFGDRDREQQEALKTDPNSDIRRDVALCEAEPDDENPTVPAGYTYLGQFIDHDITLDTASSLEAANDPEAIIDFRTPRFDLDSVYGRGPADQPYLYDAADDTLLLTGPDRRGPGGASPRTDHPRNPQGVALTGDPRNDENLIVLQLHTLFARFHNAVMRTRTNPALPPAARFADAQRQTRWHYQWVVLNDFLPRVVGRETFDAVFNGGRPDLRFYAVKDAGFPYIPVEFSVAAYRFGHSMVRPSYSLNNVVTGPQGGAASGRFHRIPVFTPDRGPAGELANLNGFRPLPGAWGIDWSFFFDGLTPPAAGTVNAPCAAAGKPPALPQPSYRIDTHLVDPLKALQDVMPPGRAVQLARAAEPAAGLLAGAAERARRGPADGRAGGGNLDRRGPVGHARPGEGARGLPGVRGQRAAVVLRAARGPGPEEDGRRGPEGRAPPRAGGRADRGRGAGRSGAARRALVPGAGSELDAVPAVRRRHLPHERPGPLRGRERGGPAPGRLPATAGRQRPGVRPRHPHLRRDVPRTRPRERHGGRLRRPAAYRRVVRDDGRRRRPPCRRLVRPHRATGAGAMRSRPLDALLAAAATLAAVLGLTTLTENASWLGRAAWACLAVALVGVAMRRLTGSAPLVALAQVVLTAWFVVAMFAPEDLWYGLPGPASWDQIGALVNDCVAVMTRYAAPVPATEGVQLVIVAAVAALALFVDLLALTLRAPAAAGLPLLAAFLTAAANSGSSLSPWYFVVAAVMWLILVSRQASTTVRGWSTTVANPSSPASTTEVETEALGGFGSVARRLGVVAVLAAVVLPAVIPHLPTRYVLDGLGRNDSSVGRGGRVGFSSTLELARSLQSGSQNVVLTYRSSVSTAPPPLKVVTASTYVDGQWRPRPVTTRSPLTPQTTAIAPQVKVVDRDVQVESNALEPPNVASVQPVVSADIGVQGWYADATTGDLFAPQRPDSYGFSYREVDVTGEQLKSGIAGGSTGRADPEVQASTLPEPSIGAQIRAVTESVTQGTDNAYDAAVAIQDWLRSGGGFTYSLQLVDTANDAQGRPISDPILKFLATKQGYCVQFASAMVMMARAEGIPARMAIGFLPGTLQNGIYTVRSSDAHAWPELFFPGAGWLRFEPTPAARTGTAPAYTLPAENPASATATATDTVPGSTATATSTLRDPGAPEVDGTTVDASLPLSDRLSLWFQEPRNLLVLALVLGLLGTFVLPLTAWLVNRRRRARAAGAAELAEAQWDELVSRLGDLGVSPPPGGGTLREWRRHYAREAYLAPDADDALGVVVATLESARYARPGAPVARLAPEIRTVTRAAAASRPLPRRLRAFFLPRDGARWWNRFANLVADAPGRWAGALLDRLPKRR